MDISAELTQQGRRWTRVPGATDIEIGRLTRASPVALPQDFLQLLRFSNGGEGDLALPPLMFVLDSVDDIVAGFRDPFLTEYFPGFLFMGGNGGLERIAFDLRGRVPPWPIVMIDPIAGPDSAVQIASDIQSFVAAIGLEHTS